MAFLSFLILMVFIFSLFVLVSLERSLSILLIFQRIKLLVSLIFLYQFSTVWFTDFCFDVNYFLFSACREFNMLRFFFFFGSLLIYKWRHWFETFLIQAFGAINFCLRDSPQILISCILIFIQFKILSTFPFYFSLTHKLFRNVLFSYQSGQEFSGDLSFVDF